MEHHWLYILVIAELWSAGTKPFVIEGKVKNVKQGVCLNLFQMEGSVGSSIAVDTLRGDSFRLKYLFRVQVQPF